MSSALPKLDNAQLRATVARVARDAGYRLVVLFGSAARGDSRPHDLDLAIDVGREHGTLDALDATNRLVKELRRTDIDVVDLRRANPVLLMAVAREGIPVYEQTGTEFTEFSSLAMRRYADTKKFRDALREYLRERAGVAGDHTGT